VQSAVACVRIPGVREPACRLSGAFFARYWVARYNGLALQRFITSESYRSTMPFEDLIQFIERDMRMSHVYQPVMLRALLDRSGRASVEDVARALLNEDRSQLEYYFEITRNMVGRVLTNRAIVKRDGAEYELLGYNELTPEQVQKLGAACDRKLAEYIASRCLQK
jgi:hypothetical protein